MTKPKTRPRPADRDWGSPPARGKTVHVRLTDQEHANMVTAARAEDMLPSEYVRACLHHVMSRGLKP